MALRPEPVHPDADDRPEVSRGWIGRFGLLYLGQNVAWAGPSQLLIANQIATWFPGEKEERLAWLMALGGLVSMVATPLAGGLVAGLAPVWMGFAPGYAVLVAGWLVFQAAIAFSINATQSVAPDQVPRRQYGLVSGVMGVTYTLAIVVGTLVATLFASRTAYLVTAALLVGLVVQYLVRFHDPRVIREREPEARATRPPLSTLVPSPREHPDYAWVFLTRLLLTRGNTIALFYLLYFLRDRVRVPDPDAGVLTLTVVYAVAVVATAVLGGRWSDRLDRRRVFVAPIVQRQTACTRSGRPRKGPRPHLTLHPPQDE